MSWMKCICPSCTDPHEHDVPVPESDFDELIERIKKLETALKQIKECDWPGSGPEIYSRADWMQQVAREALE